MASPEQQKKSLDALLAEIHQGSAEKIVNDVGSTDAGVNALTARLLTESAGGGSEPHAEFPSQSAMEIMMGKNNAPLTKRQMGLPKIDLTKMVGLVAVLFLVVGLGSATYLTQFNQDNRQQASDGRMAQYQAVLDQVREQNQVDEVEKAEIEKQEAEKSKRMFVGGIIIVVAVLLLVAALFWAFAV